MRRLYPVSIPLPAVTPPVVALCLRPAAGPPLRMTGRLYTNSTAVPFAVVSAFALRPAGGGGAAGQACVLSDASQTCTAAVAYG